MNNNHALINANKMHHIRKPIEKPKVLLIENADRQLQEREEEVVTGIITK